MYFPIPKARTAHTHTRARNLSLSLSISSPIDVWVGATSARYTSVLEEKKKQAWNIPYGEGFRAGPGKWNNRAADKGRCCPGQHIPTLRFPRWVALLWVLFLLPRCFVGCGGSLRDQTGRIIVGETFTCISAHLVRGWETYPMNRCNNSIGKWRGRVSFVLVVLVAPLATLAYDPVVRRDIVWGYKPPASQQW